VEISKNKRNLQIKLWSKEARNSADLRIRLEEAEDLLGGSQDFERFVEMLSFENGQFVLDVDIPLETDPVDTNVTK
jgi:hypothetical protein